MGREWAVQEFRTCSVERCSVKEKGWLQTKARKGHPYSHFIFITMGKPVAKVHTPGLHEYTAQKLKACGEIYVLNRSKHRVLAAMPRHRDRGFRMQPQLPKINVIWTTSPLCPAFFSLFSFFGVSDRLIKDYNLSSSEGQGIGLAISNLIFFQVAAKLKFCSTK